MNFTFLFGFLLHICTRVNSIHGSDSIPPIIETKSGKVSGVFKKSYSGKDYMAYLGIPFAESPTGNLRFKAPVPKKVWTDVKDGSQEGKACLQVSSQYLNYYFSGAVCASV